MTQLLVIRHGQSEWNADGRWQGQENPPLTELGRQQARSAARAVGAIDALFASPLDRAATTAAILSEELGVGPVVTLDGLMERNAGEWQGLTRDDIEEAYPGYLDSGRRPPGWEPDDEQKVWEVLRLLDIESLAMSNFSELSGGQQQKVLIARALVQEAEVMLLDEPTSNLDIWHQLDVMNIIRDVVKKKEITAIMALHDLNLASHYSDRIIMMKKGKIIAAGDPQSVITEENIASVYRVEAAVRSLCDRPMIMPLRQIRGGSTQNLA